MSIVGIMESEEMKKLTIFTPVYNREILIYRLYESLLKMKYKNFEWVIVDDGSTDNTAAVIQKMMKENKIEIKYYYKKNGGKHTAYNLGIDKAQGELFVIVDSDDVVLENGFFEILQIWENLQKKNQLLGISGIDYDSNLNVIGDKYPISPLECSHLKMREVYNVHGDKTEIFRTDLLKGYHFPIFKSEKFLTEAILFEKLYKKYDSYFVNIPLIIRDYQKKGLSDNSLKLRVINSMGAKEYYKQNIQLCLTKKKKFKSQINYCRFSFHSKAKIKENIGLAYVLGFVMYLFDNIRLYRKKYE